MTLRYTILHLSEWLGSKALITAYAGEDVEKEEHSFIAGGNENLYNHSEISIVVSQKIGNQFTSRPSITTLGHILIPQGHLFK